MQFRNIAVVSIAATISAIALSMGGAQAASTIWDSSNIKDESLTTQDVKNSTLKTEDLSQDAKDALKGQQGTPGIDGKNGIDGIDGIDGKDAEFNTYLVKNQFQIPAGDGVVRGTSACDAGDQVLSGGYSSNDHTNHWSKVFQNSMTWVATGNEDTPDGWHVEVLGGDAPADIYVWALCLAA